MTTIAQFIALEIRKTLYLRSSQVGAVSDHVPLASQVRVVLPERMYPELQL